MHRLSLLRIAFVAAMAVTPALYACSSDSPKGASVATTDVIREGNVTDAQLSHIITSAVIDWAWAGGQFDTPDPNQVLSASTPFEFSWHADETQPEEAGGPNDFQMVHRLVFSTDSQPSLLRVVTTLDSYTPDDATWQKLVAAGEPIWVRLVSGTFAGDDWSSEGGPYIGQDLTFTIE